MIDNGRAIRRLLSTLGVTLLAALAFGASSASATGGWLVNGAAFSGEATFASTGTFEMEISELNIRFINCKETSSGRIYASYKLEEETTLNGCEVKGSEKTCHVEPIYMHVATQPNKYRPGEGIHTLNEFQILTTIKATGSGCALFGGTFNVHDPEYEGEGFKSCAVEGIGLSYGAEAAQLPVSTYTCPLWGLHYFYFWGASTWELTGAQAGKKLGFGTPQPGATTLSASEVGAPETTLNGTVNPLGASTYYHFEYGPTASYGTWIPALNENVGSGIGDVNVSQTVKGLESNKTYHYRVVASNGINTSYGEDKTFTTPEWGIQTAADPPTATLAQLYSVWCLSSEACAAVGNYYESSTGVFRTLAKVESGGKWSLTTTPNPANGNSFLYDVSCSAASACTAVGTNTFSGVVSTLAERWNGSEWTIQSTPNVSGTSTYLFGVACVASNDCTAVGYSAAKSEEPVLTLTEHWNGTSWTITSPPNPEGFVRSYLYDISCVSASDCWAVGKASLPKPAIALAEHWNGTSWTINSPSEMPENQGLTDVSCGSSSSCVAVTGESLVVARWNGSTWSKETAPTPENAKKRQHRLPAGSFLRLRQRLHRHRTVRRKFGQTPGATVGGELERQQMVDPDRDLSARRTIGNHSGGRLLHSGHDVHGGWLGLLQLNRPAKGAGRGSSLGDQKRHPGPPNAWRSNARREDPDESSRVTDLGQD